MFVLRPHCSQRMFLRSVASQWIDLFVIASLELDGSGDTTPSQRKHNELFPGQRNDEKDLVAFALLRTSISAEISI